VSNGASVKKQRIVCDGRGAAAACWIPVCAGQPESLAPSPSTFFGGKDRQCDGEQEKHKTGIVRWDNCMND